MRALLITSIGLASFVLTTPSLSHHSFSAEFDVGRPVEFTGTIIRVEWTNPHVWLFLVTDDGEGNLENWDVELLGINTLMRRGLTRDSIKPGYRLVVRGFGARDGTNTANASFVGRADTGEEIWASASGGRTP